ncbi:hypothetical protein H1R20_g11391, partial [Candolleomyces eurysporus]
MIARVFAVLAASSVFLAATAAPAPGDVSQCKSGYVACCKSVQKADSLKSQTRAPLEQAGVDVGRLTGLVASECSTFGPETSW